MLRPLIVVALCGALLVACHPRDRQGVGLPESEWSSERVRLLMNPPSAEPEPEEAKAPAVPLPRRRPEQLAVAVPGPGSDAKQEAVSAMEIDQIVGLDFDATRALLGFPALDEVQPPARVWAYNGNGCVLSIFFYPHVDGSTYRALTYEVKGGDESAEFRNHCFADLVREREKEGT